MAKRKLDGAEAASIVYGAGIGLPDPTVRDVLHNIQKNIIVGKSRFNKFGNYHYRSAEDIVDAVKALLPEGASLKITDEMIMLGNRYYIKATAMLLYKDGQEEACGYAREAEIQKGMSEGQITGSTSSYARKYALNGLFAIDDGVDADSQSNGQKSGDQQSERNKESHKEPLFDIEAAYAICIKQIAAVQLKSEFINMWNSEESKNRRKQIKAINEAYYAEINNRMKDKLAEYAADEERLLGEFNKA